MLTFLTYFVLVINGNRINRFHLFWDTLQVGKTIRTNILQYPCNTKKIDILQRKQD